MKDAIGNDLTIGCNVVGFLLRNNCTLTIYTVIGQHESGAIMAKGKRYFDKEDNIYYFASSQVIIYR